MAWDEYKEQNSEGKSNKTASSKRNNSSQDSSLDLNGIAKVLHKCNELSKDSSYSTINKVNTIIAMPEATRSLEKLEEIVYQLFGINTSLEKIHLHHYKQAKINIQLLYTRGEEAFTLS